MTCRERNRISIAKYRRENPERAKEIYLRSDAKRPGRFAENRRRYAERLKDAIYKKYGDACNKCGFSDRRAFQIDHVNGGGTQERNTILKSANTYWRHVLNDETGKFQLLCANCNSIKRHEKREFFFRG